MAKAIKIIPFDARKYMTLAIAEMDKSKNEPRHDGKVPPKVGAVIVFPDGKVYQAHRGELREGDHAEYTLLERRLGHEKLEECVLFTTLEPCVERNPPKVPCCRRTTNARIKTVYIGIEDPDPTVAGKGITHLEKNGVTVKMFDRDLQKQIELINKDFLKQALERKRQAEEEIEEFINPIEQAITTTSFEEFSPQAMQKFIDEAGLNFQIGQPAFHKYLRDLGVLSLDKTTNSFKPNGFGILLFGINPRLTFKNAAFKCTANLSGYELKPESFDQPLVLVPDLVEDWIKKALAQQKDTTNFKRKVNSSFPIEVLREAVINAIVHRDYTIEGAKNSIKIDNDKIEINSPGAPPASITLQQLNAFKAPSISRNPIITYVFNLMGYVEETGLGMSALRTLNEKYQLPSPEYTFAKPFLNLTFARTIEAVKKVSHHIGVAKLSLPQLIGYEWLKTIDAASTREYSNHFNIGYKTAQRHLAKMKEVGLIGDNGLDSNSPNYKYLVIS